MRTLSFVKYDDVNPLSTIGITSLLLHNKLITYSTPAGIICYLFYKYKM